MRSGRVSLNTLIALEVSALLLLVAVLIMVLPLVREDAARPDAETARPGAIAPPRVARSTLQPDWSPSPGAPPPVARLRSHRFTKALKAVPAAEPGMTSLSSRRVKTEPFREIGSKIPRAPDATPHREKRTPRADLPI